MKKIIYLLIAVLVIIQFIRPDKNVNEVNASNTINAIVPVPENVQSILKTACNDCHSNNTAYPWYNNIQPVMWMMTKHVNEGKEHLNFDEFASYPLAKQYHKIEEVQEVIEKNEMPLSSYTLIHKDAKLTDAQKKIMYDWVNASLDDYKSKYPADSLIMKRPPNQEKEDD